MNTNKYKKLYLGQKLFRRTLDLSWYFKLSSKHCVTASVYLLIMTRSMDTNQTKKSSAVDHRAAEEHNREISLFTVYLTCYQTKKSTVVDQRATEKPDPDGRAVTQGP